MGLETTRWDAADHLDSTEAVLAYLDAVFEDGDAELIAAALNDIARSRGMPSTPALSAQIGLDAVIGTLKQLGLELTARPMGTAAE
ncbi:MAG: transcriptional regulator [Novosphingobium sp.]